MNPCSIISTLPDHKTVREYTLRLYNNEERVDLPLYPAGSPRVLSEIVTIPKIKVYFNHPYDGQLISSHTWDIKNMVVEVNNYPVNMTFYPANGTIRFSDNAYQHKIFYDSFGLSQIRVSFKCSQGWQTLESIRFQVLVHPGEENQTVDRMGRYISARNRILLFGTQSDYSSWTLPERAEQRSLEDKVRLLKKMALVMESCWRWIRTNPRVDNSSCSKGYTGGFGAVAYLSRHPEALHASNALHGIRIGSRSYLPILPGKTSQVQSTDVYENQAVLAFLRNVYADIQELIRQLQQARHDLPTRTEEWEGFISSSFFMYHASRLAIENLLEDLDHLASQYSQLYEAYRSAIPASDMILSSMPIPTPAFRSLPAYRQIFEHMFAWFSLSSVTAQDMRFMETFLQVTTLYEVFVLSRLLEFMFQDGFELVSARMHHYEFDSEVLYENTSINNVFEFTREDLHVTLYYQPVIYDEKKQPEGLVGLYRNTSLSYPKGWAEPSRGKYYTPDYLIEISREGMPGKRYILGDAKYTTIRNVRDYKVFPLIYKYLFSLSCKDSNDRITGLYIFQGKSVDESRGIVHSIYDLSSSPHSVFPQMEIISLRYADAAVEKAQYESLRRLLSIQFQLPKQKAEMDSAQPARNPSQEIPFENESISPYSNAGIEPHPESSVGESEYAAQADAAFNASDEPEQIPIEPLQPILADEMDSALPAAEEEISEADGRTADLTVSVELAFKTEDELSHVSEQDSLSVPNLPAAADEETAIADDDPSLPDDSEPVVQQDEDWRFSLKGHKGYVLDSYSTQRPSAFSRLSRQTFRQIPIPKEIVFAEQIRNELEDLFSLGEIDLFRFEENAVSRSSAEYLKTDNSNGLSKQDSDLNALSEDSMVFEEESTAPAEDAGLIEPAYEWDPDLFEEETWKSSDPEEDLDPSQFKDQQPTGQERQENTAENECRNAYGNEYESECTEDRNSAFHPTASPAHSVLDSWSGFPDESASGSDNQVLSESEAKSDLPVSAAEEPEHSSLYASDEEMLQAEPPAEMPDRLSEEIQLDFEETDSEVTDSEETDSIDQTDRPDFCTDWVSARYDRTSSERNSVCLPYRKPAGQENRENQFPYAFSLSVSLETDFLLPLQSGLSEEETDSSK